MIVFESDVAFINQIILVTCFNTRIYVSMCSICIIYIRFAVADIRAFRFEIIETARQAITIHVCLLYYMLIM